MLTAMNKFVVLNANMRSQSEPTFALRNNRKAKSLRRSSDQIHKSFDYKH